MKNIVDTLHFLIIQLIISVGYILWGISLFYCFFSISHNTHTPPRVLYPSLQSCMYHERYETNLDPSDPTGNRMLKDTIYVDNIRYQTNPALAPNETCKQEINESHRQINHLVAKLDSQKSELRRIYETEFRVSPPTFSCNNAQGQLTCQVAKIDLSHL